MSWSNYYFNPYYSNYYDGFNQYLNLCFNPYSNFCVNPCANPCANSCCNPCNDPCGKKFKNDCGKNCGNNCGSCNKDVPISINAIMPTTGCPGTSFTITGTGLENARNVCVRFISPTGAIVLANNVSINGGIITGTVPNFAVLTATNLQVLVRGETFNCNRFSVTSPVPFTLTPTSVTSVSPTTITRGSTLSIVGSCLLPTSSVLFTSNVGTFTIPYTSFTTFNSGLISLIIPTTVNPGTYTVILNLNNLVGSIDTLTAGTITIIA